MIWLAGPFNLYTPWLLRHLQRDAAVANKLAATQDLQRKDTGIEIERKERTKREVQARGRWACRSPRR